MKNAPNLWTVEGLLNHCGKGPKKNLTTVEVNGRWVPARPLGYHSLRTRLTLAWLVFTGQADALTWPHLEPQNLPPARNPTKPPKRKD